MEHDQTNITRSLDAGVSTRSDVERRPSVTGWTNSLIMNEYTQQAKDFLAKTGTEIKINFIATKKHFPGDKENRDVYSVSLVRGDKAYTFEFGDSIKNTEDNRHAYARKKPTAYDVLALP